MLLRLPPQNTHGQHQSRTHAYALLHTIHARTPAQSVALRMVCDREAEIEKFTPREFWSVTARLVTPDGSEFDARLTHADGGKIPATGIPDRAEAEALAARVAAGAWSVGAASRRPGRRAPPPPFTTSSLQQEAARRLGWGAGRTMSAAQQLYEGKDAGRFVRVSVCMRVCMHVCLRLCLCL